MSRKNLIQVTGVTRYYGPNCALRNVSFNADRGEITGFLGPNGAGKSTLMQIICGVMAATEGTIRIDGLDLLGQARQSRARLGYLPEQSPLYGDCTVDEYLDYCASLRRLPRTERAKRIQLSKEKCGLTDMGKRLIGNLSKGYQQRTGLAQAIIHEPPVLVLDEPSSGLDPKQMVEMRELIKLIGEDHCVVLSTHLLSEAQELCDRVLIINRGSVVLDRGMRNISPDNVSGQAIVVRLAEPPSSLDDLVSLDGVDSATPLGENRFRLQGITETMSASITAAASRNNWQLMELVSGDASLEQVYLQITSDTQQAVNDSQHSRI